MLESVERVFQAAETAVSSMKDGDRMQLKQLVNTVSVQVGMDPKYVLPFVSHYVHNTVQVYVARGKNGGIIKGSKSPKQS